MKLRPKNWQSFQHYKDRAPPWIRLHKALLDDFDFQCLHVASRALAPMLWLLASESSDPKTGIFDANPRKMAFRLRMSERDFIEALKPLIESGFFSVEQDASDALAQCLRDAVPEAEAEAEAEERSSLRSDSSSADADDQQAGKAAKLESRLAQITADAIETFNASALTKPDGALSRVTLDSSVRRKQVKRCLDVSRAICRRMYGSERIASQFWTDYWLAALADDFAAGRTQPGRGHENWRPDFEYLTRPDVMTKLFDRAVEDAA